MIEQGELTAGQARPLIGMPNASSIAEEIVAKKLSARSIENLKKKTLSRLPSIQIYLMHREKLKEFWG